LSTPGTRPRERRDVEGERDHGESDDEADDVAIAMIGGHVGHDPPFPAAKWSATAPRRRGRALDVGGNPAGCSGLMRTGEVDTGRARIARKSSNA
jgi:hypothetical protein